MKKTYKVTEYNNLSDTEKILKEFKFNCEYFANQKYEELMNTEARCQGYTEITLVELNK